MKDWTGTPDYYSKMRIVDIIAAKRDGIELQKDDIESLIRRFVDGEATDYQMAAFSMAVLLNGMTPVETAALTKGMLYGSAHLSFDTNKPVVDKHSTGGVGDKTSLVLAPLLAAGGFAVPMISGRGLGLTGGTLDKLESIGGFNTSLTEDQMAASIEHCGCFIAGATPEIVPADHRLYLLRDATATVPSVPLITASILSKKLVEGLNHLVLDVKCGNGAHCKTLDEARELATSLVETATELNLSCNAIISNMDSPLGSAIGNSLEVIESIDVLEGTARNAVRDLAIALADAISDQVESPLIDFGQLLDSGVPLQTFERMVQLQGGSIGQISTAQKIPVQSNSDGYICRIDAEELAKVIPQLGGARSHSSDTIDHSVGVTLNCSIGDHVAAGDVIAFLHANDATTEIITSIQNAVTVSNDPLESTSPLVFEIINPS